MGVVYKAKDTKLGRAVALKFLPPQWSHDEGAKQRFLREAQAASATNHRNICVIHDIEQTDDGQLFIVMAHYDGQTLKQKLEAGALPVADALEIAAEVAEGLAKAHAQGVVHRDIKPGNLILTEDGVKILDFGLAKFADALQLTQPGSTLGTVAYMAPEQARGEEADERSDVWALGVVLYEMLAGGVPFKGTYPEAIFYAIKNETPAPLSAPGRDIPEAVERVVMRALTKDQAGRFQSARDLARELRFLQGRSLPLDLRTEALDVERAAAHALKPRAKRFTLARAMAVAGVLAVIAGGAYAWLARPLPRIPIAIVPVANHTGEPDLDAYRLALTEALIEELEESPNIRVVPYFRLIEIVRRFIGRGDASSSEAIQTIATQAGARVLVMPALEYRSETRTWFARVQFRNVETGTSADSYETAAVTSSLPKETAYRLIESLAEGIQQHFKITGPGRSYRRRPAGSRFRNVEAARAFAEGLDGYEQLEYSAAFTAFSRAVSLDDQNAMAHAWLSRVLLILNRASEAVGSGQRAKQLLTAETPKTDAAFIEGTLAEGQADVAGAEERYRRLAALATDDPAAHTELADFLRRQDRNQQAVDAYHEVLRLDPKYARPHVDLCQLYTRLDDHPLAEQQSQTAVERYRTAGDRAGEAQALLCLGEAQRQQAGKRLPDARRNIEAARQIFESLDRPYSLSRVSFYQALVEYTDGNMREADAFFSEAVSRSRGVGNRLTEGVALMNLGVTHHYSGQRAQAVQYYQQSRDVYEQMGDQRRAAEQDINAAALQVNYGGDQTDALRRLANARATLEKLGYVNFEVVAMETDAASQRYAGRLAEARRELLAALSIATEKQLNNRVGELAVEIAKTDFLQNDYEAARKSLDDLVAHDTDRKNLEARIVLARILVKLGDFEAAKANLDQALVEVETHRLPQFVQFAPVVHTALGELAFESGRLSEARAQFDRASALWLDDFPDAASVEARSYLGLLDALTRSDPAATKKVEASVQQAKKMGRLALEALCRVHLARIEFGQRRYGDGLAVLNDVPLEGERTIGPELQAQVRYWRSLAMAERGDRVGSQSEVTLARKLAQQLRASLPASDRDRFASRRDIRPLFE
jgi:tetratricopeptide (TPR) repeat protein